jgi:hypothetical protein
LATLNIQGIEAEAQPGVSFEVYLGPPGVKTDPQGRQYVGVFALFSGGIKTRKHHYSPGAFVFPAERALRAAGNVQELEVVLVPTSGLDEGRRTQQDVKLAAPLSIGEFSIGVDKPMPTPPKDEQDRLRREEGSK